MIVNTYDSKILLDTSIIIRNFRVDKNFAIPSTKYNELIISQVVLAELYSGAFRLRDPEKELIAIEKLLTEVSVLLSDERTAKFYGQISAQLSFKGKTIPQNDIWIAATALQHDLPLATIDRHFEHVDGLEIILW